MRLRPVAVTATLLGGSGLALAACGGGAQAAGSAPPTAARSHPASDSMGAGMRMSAPGQPATGPAVATGTIDIQNFRFSPGVITVKVGSTVTWTNTDDEAHTVFFAYDQSLSPVLVNTANVYTKRFTTPGTFTYHCTIHPFMVGTVEVTA